MYLSNFAISNIKMNFKGFCISITCIFQLFCCAVFAQKKINLEQAQQSLLKNNVQLIAEQYNISAADAYIIQAKIWENPSFNTELNFFEPNTPSFFNLGSTGSKNFSIQQLIYVGGKKKNEIDFAKSNSKLAQIQFQQVLLNLKFQLSKNFYSIYYNIQKLESLKEHIDRLDNLVTSYQNQVIKGNVQLPDVVRLQSLLLEIQQDYSSISNENIALMQDFKLISGINDSIELVLDEDYLEKYKSIKLPKLKIIDSFIQINPEILYANAIIENRETYLKWQKSLAKIDLSAGLLYDQGGGTFANQVDLTIGINLPLWNKNKGNIKAASIFVEQGKKLKEAKKNEVLHNFETAWQQWHINVKQTKNKNDIFIQNLKIVYDNILENFGKGNISIIEFCDFIEGFHDSGLQLNEIKKVWMISSLQLNYICNIELF